MSEFDELIQAGAKTIQEKQSSENAQAPKGSEESPAVVETEQVEDTNKERSLNTETEESQKGEVENHPPQEVETSPSNQEQNQEQEEEEAFTPDEFVSYVYEQVGEDEQIVNALLSKLGVERKSFASPEVEKINQWIAETGRSAEDYYFVTKTLNTEGMDAEKAVKAQMALENPDLSSEEIELLFQSQYKLNEDEHDENEVRVSKVRLKVDGQKAIKGLNELKEKYSQPIENKGGQNQPQSLVPSDFDKALSESLSDLESFSFSIRDGKDWEYKLQDGDNASIAFNPQDPLARWRNENGSIDPNSLADDLSLLQNIDKIVRAAYNQGSYEATENNVREKKNVNLLQQNIPEKATPPQSEKFEQGKSKVLEALFGRT